MTLSELPSDSEALGIMGFRKGETVSLPPHINPSTRNQCDGVTGKVADVAGGGAIGYVTCDTCDDTLRLEL